VDSKYELSIERHCGKAPSLYHTIDYILKNRRASLNLSMEIDKAGTGTDESIVLFPRSYNKRGDERLHSVQGVTLDGREVNVKLRVDESMQGKENTPSIAEFAREDVKGKNPCLASVDNAPDNREGVLLFTGCEEDGENRKGIQSYTARWGYVLASHSDSPEPVFGLGRVVMIAESVAAKSIHQELTELEKTKPEGWEAIAERKRRELNDPMLFSYYGQLYQPDEEKTFALEDRQAIINYANDTFLKYTKQGVVGGLLIRAQVEDGSAVSGFSTEIFPRWKRNSTYQTADDVMGFFFQANATRLRKGNTTSLLVMPIMRYSCGPSFKNYYFLKKPDESLLKLRKRFLINNEPTVCQIAFALSRREETGESFMMKYYPLSNPISSVADIGRSQIEQTVPAGSTEMDRRDYQLRPVVGLSAHHELFFPAWHRPILLIPGASIEQNSEDKAETVEDAQAVLLDEPDGVPEALTDAVVEHVIEAEDHSPSVEVLVITDEEAIQAPAVQEGDLSDIFADFTEEELEEIAKAEQIALEASRLLEAQALAEQEALEALQDSDDDVKDVLAESSMPAPAVAPVAQPEPPQGSDLALTDLSTDAVSPTAEEPAQAEVKTEIDEASVAVIDSPADKPADPNSAVLGWMKNRGLL
jgi:hypothetical protein